MPNQCTGPKAMPKSYAQVKRKYKYSAATDIDRNFISACKCYQGIPGITELEMLEGSHPKSEISIRVRLLGTEDKGGQFYPAPRKQYKFWFQI